MAPGEDGTLSTILRRIARKRAVVLRCWTASGASKRLPFDRRGIRFVFGSHDRARPPGRSGGVFRFYFGGPVEENARDNEVAVDPLGNTYVAGITTSLEFPTTLGALQPVGGGGDVSGANSDGFVTKFSRTGAFVYSTYLGGSAWDQVNAIWVSGYGDVYVGGSTISGDFPTTPGALRTKCPESPSRCSEPYSFVARLNLTGSALEYSTLVAPGSVVRSIAIDTAGRAVVGGTTSGGALPTTPVCFKTARWRPRRLRRQARRRRIRSRSATYFGGGGSEDLTDIGSTRPAPSIHRRHGVDAGPSFRCRRMRSSATARAAKVSSRTAASSSSSRS